MKSRFGIMSIVFGVLMLALSSCQKEDKQTVSAEEIVASDNTEVTTRAEVAALLNHVLLEPTSVENLATLILENGGDKESLTFKEIVELKHGTDVRIAEMSTLFCAAVTSAIAANAESYPVVSAQMASKTKGIDDNLKNTAVELYIPYSENFSTDDIQDLTIVYTPEDEWATRTTGVRISQGVRSVVPVVDDDYMKDNLTVVVMPEDKDVSEYTPLVPDSDVKNFPVGSGAKGKLPNGLITQNVTNSALIGEEDILLTKLARIRVTNTSWAATFTNKLKLAIYRTSADYKVEKGTPVIIPKQYKIAYYPILKKDIRKGKWIEANTIFDDDWDLHEYNQVLFFCSEHLIQAGKINLSGTVSLGYANGKPSANLGLTADFSFSIGDSRLRANNEITRKSVLATNMSDIGNNTHDIGGHKFAVRNYGGCVDLVLTMYYTDYE